MKKYDKKDIESFDKKRQDFKSKKSNKKNSDKRFEDKIIKKDK